MTAARLLPADHDLLLELLRVPTAGPLETGAAASPMRLWNVQHAYADAAATAGLVPVLHEPASKDALDRECVPLPVRAAAELDPAFLAVQPNLVLRLGPELPAARTVMFNVHLDTVAGTVPVSFDGDRFTGRGAVDAKGPAVALLAGVRAAVAAEPAVGRDVGVLVQAVSGEEGGAMGTIGTRPLVDAGYVGRLNVFCEPTGMRYLPRATAAMTACVRVDGVDAHDDGPEYGHNASVLLGFLAQHLAHELPAGARACLGGLHTGHLHNKVYGSGRLLVNLRYASAIEAARLESAIHAAVHSGLAAFATRFGGAPAYARTAADAAAVTRLEWLKRGLPALTGADPWCESLLRDGAGLARWPDAEPAFTCDAIWMDGVPGAFTVVLGPGSLAANNAHADDEYVDLADLDRFATAVAAILVNFARRPAGDHAVPGVTPVCRS